MMKRITLKFATLLVLVTAGFFFQNNSQSQAATSCWETALNTWQTCDSNYQNTVGAHMVIENTCTNQTLNNSQQQNSCADQAQSMCGSNQQCYNSAYNDCLGTAYNSCIIADQSVYDNRAYAYSDCMGIEGNGGNCVEQQSGFCTQARARASDCEAFYSSSEDGDAFSVCLANSGVSQCQ